MRAAILGLAASLLVATSAHAEDFYAGKNLNLIIGLSAGGGVDTYGRLLARHLSDHIPGNPTIVPQNMPGAGGIVAARALDTTQPTDGTAMLVFTPGLIVQALTTPDDVGVDFAKYQWIGSVGLDQRICYMSAATGVTSWAEFLARDPVIMGDNGGGGQSIIAQRILERMFGVKMQSILGYPGSAEKRLAIERGELEGDCGAIAQIPVEWVAEGKVVPIVRFQERTDGFDGDIPLLDDLADGDERKLQVLRLLNAGGDIGRPFIVSGAVPAAQVEVLRAAFDKAAADPEFLAEAAKMRLDVTLTRGADLQRKIEALYATSPEVVAEARKIIAE